MTTEMGERVGGRGAEEPRIQCLVPAGELGEELAELVQAHLDGVAGVEVLEERRRGERRNGKRSRRRCGEPQEERRRLNNADGRRVGDRRAKLVAIKAPALPPALRRYRDRIAFVKRVPLSDDDLQELEAARAALRVQAGDQAAFALLYRRYFGRVYSYFQLVLGDHHLAQDLSQEVLAEVHERLPGFELRNGIPFKGWVFRIARNIQISHLRRQGRVEFHDPSVLIGWCETRQAAGGGLDQDRVRELNALDWISDQELAASVASLTDAQRTVLTLRYPLGFDTAEIAALMGRSPEGVRMLEYRGLRVLRRGLGVADQPSRGGMRVAMRVRPRLSPALLTRRYAPWRAARGAYV